MKAWNFSPLGKLADINYGYTAKASFQINGPKFLRITDIQGGDVVWSKVPSCKIDESSYAKHKLAIGDIVFARTGATTGKSFLIRKCENSVAASYLIRVRLSNDRILPEFLYLFFQSAKYWKAVTAGTSGSAQGGFNASKLAKLVIPIPPLPEQKLIVAILDKAFAQIEQARANTEQNLRNAHELFESYLQEVFSQRGEGWVERALGQVCTFKHGFSFKSEYFCDRSDLVLLTPGNFFEEGGYRDRGEKQKYYQGPVPENFLLGKGELLVAMTEQAAGLLGSPALIPETGVFLHNQRLGLVELVSEYENNFSLEFLFHFFNTKYFRSKVQKTASGLKVRHTSPKKMQAINVWFPKNIKEQKLVAKKLFKLKELSVELQENYSQKLKELDELKKTLLQKAFSGELTSREAEGAAA